MEFFSGATNRTPEYQHINTLHNMKSIRPTGWIATRLREGAIKNSFITQHYERESFCFTKCHKILCSSPIGEIYKRL